MDHNAYLPQQSQIPSGQNQYNKNKIINPHLHWYDRSCAAPSSPYSTVLAQGEGSLWTPTLERRNWARKRHWSLFQWPHPGLVAPPLSHTTQRAGQPGMEECHLPKSSHWTQSAGKGLWVYWVDSWFWLVIRNVFLQVYQSPSKYFRSKVCLTGSCPLRVLEVVWFTKEMMALHISKCMKYILWHFGSPNLKIVNWFFKIILETNSLTCPHRISGPSPVFHR